VISELTGTIIKGNRLALARLLTEVENDTPSGRAGLNDLFTQTGKAHLVGITGAMGVGKSSLVNHLAQVFRKPSVEYPASRVAIVAVDPSSPFARGAFLGDRVRMRDLSGDPGIFIRSMAARGALGGLAHATAGLTQVLDAAGYDVILIETVGAGQAEVEIARLAHTTIVVEAPGMGDDIQASKAGILEVADILVINKADMNGIENAERVLHAMLELAQPVQHKGYHAAKAQIGEGADTPLWRTPVIRAIASKGDGAVDIVDAIRKHGEYLKDTGEWISRDHERLQAELDDLIQTTLVDRWKNDLPSGRYVQALGDLFLRRISPHQAVEQLFL
jgi:LAO/AO transport system kinase